MILTKSLFLLYLDSPLHMWAKFHNLIDLADSSAYDKLLARQGYDVESLAKEFLKQKVKNEYPEGTSIDFQYQLNDGQYQAKIDAIVYDVTNKTYDLYEIKSSTRIDRQQKYDITFQHLIAKATMPINKTYLVHINGEYIKNGDVELNEFFVIEDMSEVIENLQNEVIEKRQEALKILSSATAPFASHCHKPNVCPCIKLCHPNLSEYSIYDLSWWKTGQFQKLEEKGYQNLSDVDESEDLNLKQILQIQSIKQQKAMIDHEGICRELGDLVFPLFFLDYETFGPAVPIFDGYKPYQHIVFQFSIHVIESADNRELKHYQFLSTKKLDPSKEIVEQLLKVIGTKGSIVVWNKDFECTRNDELAILQPMYGGELKAINSRVFDLMDVFKHGLYVDYHFRGSASIKKVLPVLVPDLRYDSLEIKEGATAMTKWWEMVNANKDNSSIKKNLLKYCELDTLAMVKIWEVLIDITASTANGHYYEKLQDEKTRKN